MKYFSVLLALLLLLPFATARAEEQPDVYAPVLERTLELILNGPESHPLDSGETGIAEAVAGGKPSFTLEKIGFCRRDLDSDGSPELILGGIDSWNGDTMVGSDIYAVYTIRDGDPLLVLEGWARNRYSLLPDGTFLNTGSAGAAYSIFGIYALEAQELSCLEYFFTWGEDGIYRNDTGQMEPAVSEKLDMPVDAFWRLYEDSASRIVPLELTPFTELAMECGAIGSLVRGCWLTDLPAAPGSSTGYQAPSGNASSKIVLVPVGPVRDLQLLQLAFRDFDELGNPRFDTQVVYSQDKLEIPLIAALPFGEVLPLYGISYTDAFDQVHFCTLEISGKDGTLLMLER